VSNSVCAIIEDDEEIVRWHNTGCTTREPKTPSTYVLVKSFAPISGMGSSLPTVHHPSWTQLSGRLANCGIPARELERAKSVLDSEGSYLDAQVEALGFPA
jgi:hypothetical protein